MNCIFTHILDCYLWANTILNAIFPNNLFLEHEGIINNCSICLKMIISLKKNKLFYLKKNPNSTRITNRMRK